MKCHVFSLRYAKYFEPKRQVTIEGSVIHLFYRTPFFTWTIILKIEFSGKLVLGSVPNFQALTLSQLESPATKLVDADSAATPFPHLSHRGQATTTKQSPLRC